MNVVADTLPALMLPVTANEVNVPVEVMFGCAAVVTVAAEPDALPVIFATTVLLKFQVSVPDKYCSVAAAPLTVRPAPFAAAAVTAFLATVMFKSATSSVVALIVVVVPLTVKLPPTVISPEVVKLVNVPVDVIFGCAAV